MEETSAPPPIIDDHDMTELNQKRKRELLALPPTDHLEAKEAHIASTETIVATVQTPMRDPKRTKTVDGSNKNAISENNLAGSSTESRRKQ